MVRCVRRLSRHGRKCGEEVVAEGMMDEDRNLIEYQCDSTGGGATLFFAEADMPARNSRELYSRSDS